MFLTQVYLVMIVQGIAHCERTAMQISFVIHDQVAKSSDEEPMVRQHIPELSADSRCF